MIARNNRLMKAAGIASVCASGVLLCLKAATVLMTGSVAVLSSLLDSLQDSLTSLVNLVAVTQATAPADKKHRFGHGKAQALGCVVQAFIMTAASAILLVGAVERFFDPRPVEHIRMGVWIMGVALLLTSALVFFQTFVLRRTNALSIKADRLHYTGDILMNGGVIVSILAGYYLNWVHVDALFGIGVSTYLFWISYRLITESFAMLMDAEMPPEFRHQIQTLATAFPEVKTIHDLKTRLSGSHIFIQFNIHMNPRLTLEKAHAVVCRIEKAIQKRFPDSEAIIHPEPEEKE